MGYNYDDSWSGEGVENKEHEEETLSESGGEWRVTDLLAIKILGGRLTNEQVAFLVQKISDGSMDDCQLGAFLTATKVHGMDREEIVALTCCMRDSGRVLCWPAEWRTVDKHSTGGVGDKVSLPLAPALAALGLHVPMISGRGLGHTGGTLDKLESIPGYQVTLTEEKMREVLQGARCCIVGQTDAIAPADRRMYAARDITSTVSSIPLIACVYLYLLSPVHKKAAGSMKSLVLDIKFGNSAFMKTEEEARTLARALVEVSSGLGINTTALTTEMNNPIGKSIGNSLEVIEAMECLHGKGPADLHELVVHLGGELVVAGGLAESLPEGRRAIERVLHDGSALASFRELIKMQGVSSEVAEALCSDEPNYSMLPRASFVTPIHATTTGVVTSLDALMLAQVCQRLGAGRQRADDPINLAVGVKLHKSVGDRVVAGTAWADIHHDSPLCKTVLTTTENALVIDEEGEEFPMPSRIRDRFC
ncbi:Thymidine phosphorylase [Chionoecetes opilio]|uniref:Thymidine phosphorylase n=1 Tax=Chionoecetes opilio TaxID=41210 RepID=A0A8J5CQX8_CHIOP|nr:Thymidine phosphorylase [Chionoecetes opilio]